MRKRSEVTTAKKPSASARTETMRYDDPASTVKCDACEEVSTVGECIPNPANGSIECPACGAPITPVALRGAPKVDKVMEAIINAESIPEHRTKAPAFQSSSSTMSETRARATLGLPMTDRPAHEPPPKTYCAECGSEWPIVDGKPWSNCGHKGSSVAEPKMARRFNPPAGSPSATITGRTIFVTFGKQTFPTVPYGSFQIGPFNASAELGPGANVCEVARVLRAQLRKIADEAFDEALSWYEQKFERVKGE